MLQMELAIATRAADSYWRSQGAQGVIEGLSGSGPAAASVEHAVFASNRSGVLAMHLASLSSAIAHATHCCMAAAI